MIQGILSKLAKIAMSIVFTAVILVPSTGTSAEGSGKWVPSDPESSCPSMSSGGACPQGTTCSEWDIDGESVLSCCIPSSYLGTSELGACYEIQ